MSKHAELKVNPYGFATFPAFRAENYAYVDKTRFIEALERAETKTPFFVRPRRFGKTLFTQTLKAYYDIAAAENFDTYFAGTYIAKHKTPLANQFYVLSLDFSGISPDSHVSGMVNTVKRGINNFCKRYPLPAGHDIIRRDYANAVDILNDFFMEFNIAFDGKIYLIIDEYDQFANDILARDVNVFSDLTSAGGAIKAFYSFLKSCLTDIDDPLTRLFITGVTSISLDSLTSGFNIAGDITSRPAFASLAGFAEEDLRHLIPQIINLADINLTLDEIVQRMKDWYNGYRFSSKSDETVFNSSMCLYYLNYWRNYGCEPQVMLDPAVAADLSKIHAILKLGERKDVEAIVRDAIARKPLDFASQPSILSLQFDHRLHRDGLLTALFYFGYLTYAPESDSKLVIPNRAIAQQFFDIYFSFLRELPNWIPPERNQFAPEVEALAAGDPQPLAKAAADWLAEHNGPHKHLNLCEGDFQTSLLHIANYATDYWSVGEEAIASAASGFADALLSNRHNGPSYLFELKYLSQANAKAHPENIQKALEQAKTQLRGYLKGANIRAIPQLKAVAVVYVGMRLEAIEVL